MTTVTAEYRSTIPRSVWMTARARNAMRRPVFVGAISAATFVIALVALVVTPQQAQRAAEAIMPRAEEWPDTVPIMRRIAASRARVAAADSAVAAARARSAAIAGAASSSMSPALLAERDSLAAAATELDRLLGRVENSPLAASYRALGESPQIAGNPRVRALLDSLGEVERERESFGTSGGADPMFVALTSRATEIGRAIQALAVQRREALDRAMASLATIPAAPSPADVAAADTTLPLVVRDSAAADMRRAQTALAIARQKVDELYGRVDRARAAATVNAPPIALLAAAAVLGVVLGFGTALVDELRQPRVADEHEAERIGGIRVLATVTPRPPSPDRSRRSADRNAPPFLDPRNDGHQLVYLHVAAAAATGNLLMVTFTGDDPAISAVVAANFAAIAAEEARNVLLIDVNASDYAVASALHVRAQPGTLDVIDGRATWPEVTIPATIGRDRTIDVVPSGIGVPEPEPREIMALLQRDAGRLSRHYDTIIISASEAQTLSGVPAVLPKPDVIYCARVGHTRLHELRRATDAVIQAGGRPLGVVLWNADSPPLLTPQELAAGPRPQRTSEFPVASTGR